MIKTIRSLMFAIVLGFSMVMTQSVPVYAAGTDLTITKTIEGGITTAQVGDIIRYRIHFACSNLTTPCGPMEITDVLQAGLTYIPAQSSVPAGFTMTESPVGTIKITKDDNNLLDGSQYDAVIAVQVNYNLRPLPATINNTVTGRIAPTGLPNWENTTPASAPPVTVNGVAPNWQITKSLSSPLIEPTVDTDVTYQIQLCPITPAPYPAPGNVGLNNIVITDTLPTGAVFVSASNGGVYAPGPGTVTWSFAGPVYPPNCVTRFVTIRYNSPSGTPPGPFAVGNNVINTVDYDADYVPSTGTCTTPCTSGNNDIQHSLDQIFEVPTYSKDDIGDPIGFSGTGRFTLNLDTNNTNYPSNNLILVDTLPPQLRVTGVTSGEWDAAFDYVRAHVEYSTNYGSTYNAFTGSPVLYNTNAIFSTGLPANITNVRWRFEYDPDKTAPFNYTQAGLPYTWAFTNSPEIRVSPRAAATTADPPSGAAMPAAIAGNTYTNCVRTTRTNSSGTPVLDPCNNETMTVQGNLVSLRVSKNETPGGPWNDLDDPTILTFSPDTKILPGDTLRYTITIELTERSSENLVNPTIQDILPGDTASPIGPDFVFVRNGTATLDGGAVVQPIFTQVGQTLKWEWPSLTVTPLLLGSRYLTVEFYGYVPRGQDPGTYTNNLYALTDSTAVVCEIAGTQLADSGDVDTDGNTAEFGCNNPDPYVVERSAALRGEKWIRSISPDNNQVVLASTFLPDASCPSGGTVGLTSIPTNPFTRYPCIAQAFPEGALSPNQFAPPPSDTTIDDFEYNLRIFNDGNVPMLEYVLYDILPRVGDTGSGGVLANTARASEFRPGLTGPIQFIQGPGGLTSTDFTIEYNYTTNPCRPEVFDQPVGATIPGGCDNTWVLAGAVADWTLVRSYRIRLNNDGSLPSPSIANAVPAGSELRFGVPMHILSDALPAGFDTDDALSHEIAWNSFSHVGSYDKDGGAPVIIEDLLASEPRKVGITVPERMSVGNRIWRDADNSGTINAPDDTTPGIANVLVNLYRDTNGDDIPDGPAIASTTTDTEGYYLFSNIPYDSGNMNNNRYIIGIPASNFDNIGDPLYQLRSSTGTPATATYTAPSSNTVDSADDGINPATLGQEVLSWAFTLQPGSEPTAEADLSNNNRDGLLGQRRGVNGERDNNSDLTLDFGFFGGSDVPFSIGNHVWKDNGQGGGVINDGIRQAGEPPVVGALVRIYRDGNANGIPEAAEMIRTDITDADGFYLFDNLDPGPYYVEIAASNFQTGGPLVGWYSSQVTGSENVGVPLNTNTPNMDSDDNGIDATFPEFTGVFSGSIMLTRGTNEQTGETHLSSDTGSNPGFNPTEDDGPGSIGRFGEIDTTSNVTVDFGFIPPMSLGNRVWIDEGAGTIPFRTGYNNGL
ncbi:MAG TPA: SdrD B-like domain-containing protein, partial [Anaerolineales bacterium]|nr:SdrD B-like domain-containing protein [Anaerolineales bacterium]